MSKLKHTEVTVQLPEELMQYLKRLVYERATLERDPDEFMRGFDLYEPECNQLIFGLADAAIKQGLIEPVEPTNVDRLNWDINDLYRKGSKHEENEIDYNQDRITKEEYEQFCKDNPHPLDVFSKELAKQGIKIILDQMDDHAVSLGEGTVKYALTEVNAEIINTMLRAAKTILEE